MLIDFKVSSNTQVAAVMPLDQAVYNAQTHLANVHATPATKALHVTLLAVVMQLVQVGQPVMPLQVNVLVTLVILALRVIHVLLTTIEQFLELVQVSLTLTKNCTSLMCNIFLQLVPVMPLDQVAYNVLIPPEHVLVTLATKIQIVTVLAVVILTIQKAQLVIRPQVNVLAKMVLLELLVPQ